MTEAARRPETAAARAFADDADALKKAHAVIWNLSVEKWFKQRASEGSTSNTPARIYFEPVTAAVIPPKPNDEALEAADDED